MNEFWTTLYENLKGLLMVIGLISPFIGGLSTCHFQSELTAKDSQVANVADFYLKELMKCREESQP